MYVPWRGYGVAIARRGSALICLCIMMYIYANIMIIIVIYKMSYNTIYMLVATVH